MTYKDLIDCYRALRTLGNAKLPARLWDFVTANQIAWEPRVDAIAKKFSEVYEEYAERDEDGSMVLTGSRDILGGPLPKMPDEAMQELSEHVMQEAQVEAQSVEIDLEALESRGFELPGNALLPLRRHNLIQIKEEA